MFRQIYTDLFNFVNVPLQPADYVYGATCLILFYVLIFRNILTSKYY